MDNDITDEGIESTLENLLDEITDVKKEVSKYHQLAFKHRFSLSFTASFEDAFHSSIYEQTQARPPRIACSTCSTLVECETCTNEWYRESSLDKRCSKCGSERGLAKTFSLRGSMKLLLKFDSYLKIETIMKLERYLTPFQLLPQNNFEEHFCKAYFGTVCFVKV